MITHLIEVVEASDAPPSRDSVGGGAVLPHDAEWPRCDCGEAMALFLQLDVREEFGLPFETGSHFSLFMCPNDNDVPDPIPTERPLPDGYWNERRMIGGGPRFYDCMLHRPGRPESTQPTDRYLESHRLRFTKALERPDRPDRTLAAHPKYPGVSLSVGEATRGIQAFKVGGQPSWAQSPEAPRCSCGAEMRFLAQVPADWPFKKRDDAPPQPNSFSANDYCLFLGNETYLFACEAQCDPRAVHAIVQN